MSAIIILYLYVAGIFSGLLIVGLDRERLGGEMPAARKVVFATLLWPLLVPYLFIKGGF